MHNVSIMDIYGDKEHIPSSFDINTFKGLTDILRVHKEGKRETSFYPCCVMTLTHGQYTHTSLRGMMTHISKMVQVMRKHALFLVLII